MGPKTEDGKMRLRPNKNVPEDVRSRSGRSDEEEKNTVLWTLAEDGHKRDETSLEFFG